MAHIETVSPENATGKLAELYRSIAGSRGRIAGVHKLQSLDPDSLENHMNLYRSVVFGRSDLSRAQREMIGVVVSAVNRCAYCVAHHVQALDHFWRDTARCEALADDPETVDLKPLDRRLCALAAYLTKTPGDPGGRMIDPLKKLGLSDRGILDAVQVIAYFNFVNRLVLGLGCDLEGDPGGYIYD